MKHFAFLFALFAIALSPVHSANVARYSKGKAGANNIQSKTLVKAKPKVTTQETQVVSVKAAYNWYLRQCTDNPVVTKSTTAAIVASIGDSFSQRLEAYVAEKYFILNPARLGTFFLCGLLYVGPFCHTWYDLLIKFGRWTETKYGASRTKRVITELFVDQTLGVALFFPTFFYVHEFLGSLIRLRKPSLLSAHKKCLEQVSKVFLMQYRVFPLANFINFAFVPEQLRVLYCNIISVFWNIYLFTILA